MDIKAEVITTIKIKFELTGEEWKMLEQLIKHGRDTIQNSEHPIDKFAYELMWEVHDKMSPNHA